MAGLDHSALSIIPRGCRCAFNRDTAVAFSSLCNVAPDVCCTIDRAVVEKSSKVSGEFDPQHSESAGADTGFDYIGRSDDCGHDRVAAARSTQTILKLY